MVKLFPAEGDGAIAELWFFDCPWAQVELQGIRLEEVGAARVADVGFRVSLFPVPDGADRGWWEFDLVEVEEQLAEAREWLLDNESRRLPLDQTGLTAAGAAIDKLGDTGQSNDSGQAGEN